MKASNLSLPFTHVAEGPTEWRSAPSCLQAKPQAPPWSQPKPQFSLEPHVLLPSTVWKLNCHVHTQLLYVPQTVVINLEEPEV